MIGKKIKERRKEKNLTQEDLAKLLGVERQRVSEWEVGVHTPTIGSLRNLAKVLEVSIEDLVVDDEAS